MAVVDRLLRRGAPVDVTGSGLDRYTRQQQRLRRIRTAQNIGLALLALGVAVLVYAAIGVATR